MPDFPDDPELQALLAEFDFDLPDELIARFPAEKRDHARLLVIPRSGPPGHLDGPASFFYDLPRLLRPRDILVMNSTRVSRRRVTLRRNSNGSSPSGARIEVLFLHALPDGGWSCLIKGARKLKEGEELLPPEEALEETLEEPSRLSSDASLRFRFHRPAAGPDGHNRFLVLYPERRNSNGSSASSGRSPSPAWPTPADAEAFFERVGEPPIPPYLGRPAEAADHERYQTVYAGSGDTALGSVAAPTAGLHFTEELLSELRERGIEILDLRLRVGYGTFAPLEARNLRENRLHPETYEIPPELAARLNDHDKSDGRVIAVGTTTLRALESNRRAHPPGFQAGVFQTDIFLRPPDTIQSVQGLITNFHLPRSSLFMLVAAFAGTQRMSAAYEHAIRARYRFFSYGDACLIL